MPEVGEVIADSVLVWFGVEGNLREVERLKEAGLQFALDSGKQQLSNALEGKTIVISGNFSISRDDMKALIEAHGGKNSSSVSGKTTYLLAGIKPGPEKVKKAQELGVEIIDEGELYALLGGSFVADAPQDDNEIEPTLF